MMRQSGMWKEAGQWGGGRREPWPAPRKKPLTLYFYPSTFSYLFALVTLETIFCKDAIVES